MWGPTLPNLSPIFNLRARKKDIGLASEVEVSIGIQHVYCILPPEYLAVIVGYFSLPDWNSWTDQSVCEKGHDKTEGNSNIVYKFEVLDSSLILPVEQDDHHFLKIEIQQLYCSFIPNCTMVDVVMGIPPGYMVPAHKVAKANNCLNLFGRDLVLLFLLCKEDAHGCLLLDKDADGGNIPLIASLSADVWVRIPCESDIEPEISSGSTCIISRIHNCQLFSDDRHSLDGIRVLLDVIDQFCSVEDRSKIFTSDVLLFHQLKGSLKGNDAIPASSSEKVSTEMLFCIDSLVIKLCHSNKDTILSEPIAIADMQFLCSISLINETLVGLDCHFSSLGLHSLPTSVMLARCTGSSSSRSALHIYLVNGTDGKIEFHVSLLSLDVWLYLFEWMEVVDLCNSVATRVVETTSMNEPSECSSKDVVHLPERVTLVISPDSNQNTAVPADGFPGYLKQDSVSIIVRSKDISVTIHFPACTEAPPCKIQAVETREASFDDVSTKFKNCKFFTVTAHSTSTELFVVGRKVNLECNLDKISGNVGVCVDKDITTLPFFQISQVSVLSEIYGNDEELANFDVGIQCDRLDVQLSHKLFCFWNDVRLDRIGEQYPNSSFSRLDLSMQLKDVSLLISDERWSCGGPMIEIVLANFLLGAVVINNSMETSVTSEVEVNYNNFHKVVWEPFIEPWNFHLNVIRKHEMTALLNSSILTDVCLDSMAQLNLNFTESLIECIFRTFAMVKDAWQLMDPGHQPEIQRSSGSQCSEDTGAGSYAPYVLQNLTSLPLVYHVFQGLVGDNEFSTYEKKDTKSVQPGASVPIYLNEIPRERLYRPGASDKLGERQSNGVVHYMSIQLDGTSIPSHPISMDLVGLTYFEVDFSKASKKTEIEKTGDVLKCSMCTEETARSSPASGFVVPVVFDVSLEPYSKLIQIYSTVILSNATSVPLELRFDIPFGVSPKILDPIYPGQEFPLPLHLAEAGRLRWRPHGNCYLWSEVQDISKIISQESKIGFLRSFVCYPSLPSSDPFRCCISVQKYSLLVSGKPRKASSLHVDLENSQRSIYQITLSTPLVVNNYLPDEVSLTIENGGVTRTVLLSEGKTFFHHVDPSHDLGLEFYLHGFLPSSLTFPRTETFGEMAKFTGTKFSLTETMLLEPNLSNGPLCITVEKTMDAFSGSREIFISVPFLLCNCTGFPLNISESSKEMDSSPFTMPSCYNLIEQQVPQVRKDSLSLLASDQDSDIEKDKASISRAPHFDSRDGSGRFVLGTNSIPGRFVSKPAILSGSSIPFSRQLGTHNVNGEKTCMYNRSIGGSTPTDPAELVDPGRGKVQAYMYSPRAISSTNEIAVRVSRHVPDYVVENMPNLTWSAPFLLVPPSGSSAVLVPESSSHAAFVVSVTSNALAGSFAGRTQAITFQPRFVISNACSKDLCYKQKGTDVSIHLGIGQHSQLLWTDTTRELLVSIRFDEPGWQWSGSFLPDHLGDTQVKMWNYVSGTLSMIRVEVQNANVSMTDEEIIGSLHGNSGTIMILLSDDDTGFMPYRIDNFSKERLRIYQQRCETCDTVVHPYTSCPYAWDEPCYPHRLTIEVPGERVLGSYAVDDLTEYIPVHLKSTSEKPQRTLLLSVHAEGATKVLSVVDSSQHVLQDVKDPTSLWSRGKTKPERKQKDLAGYKEKFSLALPCIGISLINAYPQELLFVCAKNITFELLQSLDQQKISFQISSLQMDNQLPTTQYPVILFFNKEYRNNTAGQRAKSTIVKSKSDSGSQITLESTREPVLHLAVAIWRKNDISLVSFEYISLRVASFRLEIEQELILSLLDFFKALSPSMVRPVSEPTHYPLVYDVCAEQAQSYKYVNPRANQLHGIGFPAFNWTQTTGASLPSVVPIGAPWQQIYLLARRQKKIYVELFDLAPIKFTLSFSSAPWVHRNGVLTSGEFLIHRGLMALADVEGARIHLKQLKIDHLMTSWESMQDILTRHYTRQLLHEMYKVFGSAGVIGNPMGFARSLGLGIRDFLSVPARGIFQSPTGLITGMAQGTTSLVSNTVYALSDAATQFSKTAHKGIIAFTFDDQSAERMNKQQKGVASHSKGVINEVLEGLTGLLQSPIKEVEKHGLPGVLSGIALGVTGLVARPAASILEVTGKTAQSIRNRSMVYQLGSQRYRIRLPRSLSRELPLRPYSLEEAVGAAVLKEADDGLNLKDEVLVMCKSVEQPGKFIVITERLMLIVRCPNLVDVGKAEFRGVPIDPEWVIEMEIGLDSVIHADATKGVVNIVANSSETILKQKHLQSKKSGGTRTKQWMNHSAFPLYQTSLELASEKDAENLLQVLLSTMEKGKVRGWGSGYVLHQSNIL